MHNLDRTIAVEVKGDISVGNGQSIDRLLEGDVAAVQAMLNRHQPDLLQISAQAQCRVVGFQECARRAGRIGVGGEWWHVAFT